MSCEADAYGCAEHRGIGVIEVGHTATVMSHHGVLYSPPYIEHAAPVAWVAPELLNMSVDYLTVDIGEDGATITVVGLPYHLVGYCAVDRALIAVAA